MVNLAAFIDGAIHERKNFVAVAGSGIFQSGRPTILAGFEDHAYVLELSPDQLHGLQLGEDSIVTSRLASSARRLPRGLGRIEALEIYGGHPRPADEPILGRVRISGIDVSGDAALGLRVSYFWSNLSLHRTNYFDGQGADAEGWLQFTVRGPELKLKTPLPLLMFVDLCRAPRDAAGKFISDRPPEIISNSAATVLEVSPAR